MNIYGWGVETNLYLPPPHGAFAPTRHSYYSSLTYDNHLRRRLPHQDPSLHIN